METETWRPVKGYEGLYEVSSLGRIKSLSYKCTGVEKFMKPQKDKRDYLYVGLCRDGKRKFFKVHRLVAEAFLPNQLGLPEVNHKDENPSNNVVDNLEFCDAKYNANYGTRNVRSAAARRNDPARSKAVEASKYSDFREICLTFPSTQEADRNGYGQSNVSKCCRGCYHYEGNNKYKNLYWRYASVCESTSVIMQRRQIEIFANVINNFKQKYLI